MRKLLILAVIFLPFHISIAESSDRIAAYTHGFKPVGSGRLSVLFMNVYDATLFAKGGEWRAGEPLALQLVYLRDLKGPQIADRSVEEMRYIGVSDEIKLAAWHTQMRRLFPDVVNGTTLTGILAPGGESIFLHNGKEIGRIKDPDFGAAFFGIWLSENTSVPSLRKKLLGLP